MHSSNSRRTRKARFRKVLAVTPNRSAICLRVSINAAPFPE